MISNLKIYSYIVVGVLIVLLSSFLAYYKVESDKKTVQYNTLTSDYKRLENLVTESNNKIIKYKEDIKKQSEQITIINKKSSDYQTEISKLNKKIDSHNLNNIADKKPKMLEKIINSNMKKQFNEIEEITK